MTGGGAYSDTHVAVFDVNVYLDAARLVGTPFTWAKFEAAAKTYASSYIPSYDAAGRDSLVALWMAFGGNFVPGDPLEVWSSDHIENLIFLKASQPDNPQLHAHDRGMGWSWTDANAILSELHDRLVPASSSIVVRNPAGPITLGRDDGLVLATAVDAGHHLNVKYCVTKDKEFRQIGDPRGRVLVLYPHEFVQLIRKSRQALQPPGPKPPGR